MYNIHKYKEDVRMKENIKAQKESYSRWLTRHEGTPHLHIDIKNKSYDKVKNRMELFLSQVLLLLSSNNKKSQCMKTTTIKPGDISNSSGM